MQLQGALVRVSFTTIYQIYIYIFISKIKTDRVIYDCSPLSEDF